MPKQTPTIGPRPVGPQSSKSTNKPQPQTPETEPSPEEYATASKVMGRSEEPKLQGSQMVRGGNRGEEGPGGGGGSIPQAELPDFGSMTPGGWSPESPGRPSLPRNGGPSPTNPSMGAYGIVPFNPNVLNNPITQLDVDKRFFPVT